jgi:hypothetical protein
VHRRLEVAVVRDVDGERRPLRNLQRRPGDGAVVGEHPHGRIADLLLHGDDLELELVAVAELDELGPARLGQSFGLAGQRGDVLVVMGAGLVHD